MKPNYVKTNYGYVAVHSEVMDAGDVIELLKGAEKKGKEILTCCETSNFVKACQEKRHFDTTYNEALRDFRGGGLELQKSVISVPYDGMHSKKAIPKNEDSGCVSKEYAEMPVLLEDFRIVGGPRNYVLECETIKPLPECVLGFFDRVSKPNADIIVLEEEIPQLGLPKGAEIYSYPSSFSRPELYSVMRGYNDFATSIFEFNGGFSEGMLGYREIIPPEKTIERIWHNLLLKEYDKNKSLAKPI